MIRRYPRERFFALAAVFAFGFTLLVMRLVWVQMVRAEGWRAKAVEIAASRVPEPARRGSIVDRNGVVLALSERRTRVGVVRPAEWRERTRLAALSQRLDLPAPRLQALLRGREGHTVVARSASLSPEARRWLRAQGSVTFEDHWVRIHPMGELALPLLGVVNGAGDGISGLEAVQDTRLTGRAGESVVRRAADGTALWSVVVEPPHDGADLVLTLDVFVQMILEEELEDARREAKAHRAQAIVLDPRNGEVLAIAQTPRKPVPLADLGDVDPHRLMAATDAFEPGSTFKIFTAASLLSRAVCDTSQRFDGLKRRPKQRVATKKLGPGFTIRDVHAVGVVSFRHAFTTSSNIIFATAAEGLRQGEFHTDLQRFGFGTLPGSGWPAETGGKLRAVEHWSDRSLGTLAIGQELSVSLLQLAAGYAALVGDGSLRTPTFVHRILESDGTVLESDGNLRRERVVPPRVSAVLRALCRDVVDAEYGTGSNAGVPGLDVAGKTGTAQISNREGYLRGVYTPSFVGFLPADDPKLVVAIVLHRAQGEEVYGGNSAAPCFRRVVQKIASCTSYLDAGDAATPVVASETIPAPRLVGRTAADIERSPAASWVLAAPAPGPGARAVGQIPAPGTPMSPGASIHVAWWEGGG